MGMTLGVTRALADLGSGERIQLLRRMGIADQFKPSAPHLFLREVAKYVVANKLTDEFFAAYDAMRDGR